MFCGRQYPELSDGGVYLSASVLIVDTVLLDLERAEVGRNSALRQII